MDIWWDQKDKQNIVRLFVEKRRIRLCFRIGYITPKDEDIWNIYSWIFNVGIQTRFDKRLCQSTNIE